MLRGALTERIQPAHRRGSGFFTIDRIRENEPASGGHAVTLSKSVRQPPFRIVCMSTGACNKATEWKWKFEHEVRKMKSLPVLVITIVVSSCATQPMPPSAQSVGESQKSVPAVSQCIAQTWANQSQQQVVSQVILANNQAMDVYVPGQRPPDGAAALVRPSWTGNSKTWVGFRPGTGGGSNAGGAVGGCL